MKEQLYALGCLYDWSKELASCDPSYYRWNQWLFLRMWERGLAYRKTAPVNWCPGCRTVLANEQVVDGRCERSDDLVEIRDLTQWFFRVTDYAERLLEGLDRLPHWSERVKTMQRNWIGRSEGAEILFRVDGLTEPVKVFTTRPDTLYGATFLALAPEHPAVERLVAHSPRRMEIEAFVERVRRESRLDREAEGSDKEGLDTGATALNPATGEPIPVLARQLRASGLRHGRDHGRSRPRPARLRVRAQVWRADPPGLPDRRRGRGPRHADRGAAARRRARPVRKLGRHGQRAGGHPHGHRLARGKGLRQGQGRLPPAGLADLAAEVLGNSDPGDPLSGLRRGSGARRRPARPSPGGRRVPRRRRATRSCSRRLSSRPVARRAAGRRGARPTPWIPSSIPPGTSCGS